MAEIIIVGAGGQGREALDICSASGRNVIAFCEEGPPKNKKVKGLPVWNIDDLPASNTDDYEVVLAVGSPGLKRRLSRKITGFSFATLVHPSAIIAGNVRVNEGTIICAGAVLTTDIEIARHVTVNVASTISHDCVIEDYVTCSPNCSLSGNVTLEEGCFVGVGATVIEKVRVGRGTVVAAGAVVINDVPEGVLVAGIPAQVEKTLTGWY
jgi:sugar O-acyltransferase (sialic acid O-acetyltransferase NeuD family)